MTPAPISAAIAIAASTASGAGRPTSLKSFERMIPVSASSEPTDRSMPAVSTTKVMPMETTQRIETLVRRFSTFCFEKKLSWVNEKKTKRPISRTSTTA